MASSRVLAAWHEAGHAAAIKAVGELNGTVELHGHGGGVTHNRHSLFFGTTLRRADLLRIAIAGPLVESWVSGERLVEILRAQSGSGDGDLVAQHLRGESLSRWAAKTERLVRSYRPGISDLAEALLERGSVRGRDAAAILARRR